MRFAGSLALGLLLCLAVTPAKAGDCYSYGYYGSGYSYQWYNSHWSGGRFYPSGRYAYSNGGWHRYGYGPFHGFTVQQVAIIANGGSVVPPVVVPPVTPVPPTPAPKASGLTAEETEAVKEFVRGLRENKEKPPVMPPAK